jgi:hypothetical protein
MYKKDILTMNKIIKLIFVLCCFCGIAQAQPQRPKLVVGIVIDQMRWDYLYRYYARYGEGGFKRMLGEGFSVENCKIPYIPSVTDVGIAMGGLGSDAAIEAADVVLMDDDPRKIALAVKIARRTIHIAHENVIFAIGVKVAVLILATIGLGTMWMAVFADVGVTVLAVLNAMRSLGKNRLFYR